MTPANGAEKQKWFVAQNGDSVLSFMGWKERVESLGKNVTRSQFKYKHIGVICSKGQV